MIGSKELQKVSKELAKVMKFNDPTFRAFDDFDINDMPAQPIFRSGCYGGSRTSMIRAPLVPPAQPHEPLWQPASSHTP